MVVDVGLDFEFDKCSSIRESRERRWSAVLFLPLETTHPHHSPPEMQYCNKIFIFYSIFFPTGSLFLKQNRSSHLENGLEAIAVSVSGLLLSIVTPQRLILNQEILSDVIMIFR